MLAHQLGPQVVAHPVAAAVAEAAEVEVHQMSLVKQGEEEMAVEEEEVVVVVAAAAAELVMVTMSGCVSCWSSMIPPRVQ